MSINVRDENYSIERLYGKNNIKRGLLAINEAHIPPLVQKLADFGSYLEKLYRNAEVIAIIDKNENILGIIAFYANDYKEKTGYITQLAVKIQYQKKKIGRTLLRECFNYCNNKGMQQIKLEVNKNNTNAINFYCNHGFAFYKDASTTSIFMMKKLL